MHYFINWALCNLPTFILTVCNKRKIKDSDCKLVRLITKTVYLIRLLNLHPASRLYPCLYSGLLHRPRQPPANPTGQHFVVRPINVKKKLNSLKQFLTATRPTSHN